MLLGTKIFLIGLVLIGFAGILGQLAGRDIPENAKTFIGGFVFAGLAFMAVGAGTYIVML